MTELDDIRIRIEDIRARIHRATERCGRSADSVNLLAVSKTYGADHIRIAYDAGLRHFGENYAQELSAKRTHLPADIHWHMIGPLQSNKAKLVAGAASYFHALESEELAQRLERKLEETECTPLPVFIMVNVGDEDSKHGLAPDVQRLASLSHAVSRLNRVKLIGLMALPPYIEDAETVRPYFRQVRVLRDALQEATGISLPHLSMGMSHDFEVAIEEGATWVRIGTAIFGQRRYQNG